MIDNRATYVGGVKGVGKTTVVEAAVARTGKQVVDVTVWMMAYAHSGRDELDSCTDLERSVARAFAFEKAFDVGPARSLVFDSHFSIPTPAGHEWGFPQQFLNRLGPFVIIDADVYHIMRRLEADTARNRPRVTMEQLRVDSAVELEYARSAARQSGQPLITINNDDDLTIAVTQLADVIGCQPH